KIDVMIKIYTLFFTILWAWSLAGHDVYVPVDDKIKLTEALERISRSYHVYFTYDRELTGRYEVDYSDDQHRNAEEAIQLVLKETNLSYQIFDDQFVIVYLNDNVGISSVKQMITHLQDVVE